MSWLIPWSGRCDHPGRFLSFHVAPQHGRLTEAERAPVLKEALSACAICPCAGSGAQQPERLSCLLATERHALEADAQPLCSQTAKLWPLGLHALIIIASSLAVCKETLTKGRRSLMASKKPARSMSHGSDRGWTPGTNGGARTRRSAPTCLGQF